MTPTKPTLLIKNTGPTPTRPMSTPATAGPTIRAALNAAEFSATAFATSPLPTMSMTNDCRAGWSTTFAKPRTRPSTATCPYWTRPVETSTPSSRAWQASVACFPEAAGLLSPKLKTRGISTHPGGGGYGAPSHVGGQPHGPRLSSARHLHLANGPEVGRRGAARRRARRAQVVGVARRGARPVRRLRPGRDGRQARPDPRRGGRRHGQAYAAVAPDRAPRRPGARWRRSRGDLRDHRHLARSVHPPGHLRSRDAHSRLSRVQSVHRRIQPDPARSLLRARVSPQPRRDARGGRVAPLRHARPARCRARPVGLGDARVARDVGACVVHRRGDGPRRLVPCLRGRRRDRRVRGEGDPPPGGHRLPGNPRADADGRDLRLRDSLRPVRAPPQAPPPAWWARGPPDPPPPPT